jgi:hypothetical protein
MLYHLRKKFLEDPEVVPDFDIALLMTIAPHPAA